MLGKRSFDRDWKIKHNEMMTPDPATIVNIFADFFQKKVLYLAGTMPDQPPVTTNLLAPRV